MLIELDLLLGTREHGVDLSGVLVELDGVDTGEKFLKVHLDNLGILRLA